MAGDKGLSLNEVHVWPQAKVDLDRAAAAIHTGSFEWGQLLGTSVAVALMYPLRLRIHTLRREASPPRTGTAA